MRSRTRKGAGGVILMEVLLSVGLLSVLTVCLLSSFQGARKIDKELRGDLAKMEATRQLIASLREDLVGSRSIALDDGGVARGSRLTIVGRGGDARADAPVVEYHWNPADSVLSRALSDPGGRSVSRSLLRGGRVEFEIIAPADSLTLDTAAPVSEIPAEPGEEESPRLNLVALDPDAASPDRAAAIRVRTFSSMTQELAQEAAREFVVHLPVVLPVRQQAGWRP